MLSYRKKDDSYLVKDKVDNIVEAITEEEFKDLNKIIKIQRGKLSLEEYIAKCKLLGKKPEYIDLDYTNSTRLVYPEDKEFTGFPFDTSEIMSFAGTFRENKYLDVFDVNKAEFNSGAIFRDFMAGSSVREVDLTGMYAKPIILKGAFENCVKLEKFNQGNTIDVSELVDISYMFCGCDNLVEVKMDLSKAEDLGDIHSAFRGCGRLTEIDFDRDLKISKSALIADTGRLFSECENLKKVDLGHINLSGVFDCDLMFDECPSLEVINMSKVKNFDKSVLDKASLLFYSSYNLKRVYVNAEWIKDIFEELLLEHTEVIVV